MSPTPQPLDRAPNGPESRDARIEHLLLTGLDLYFAGQFEQAINVWTRVSFLERGHGRARAYIERARGAIAERQREGDELLQLGVDAFNRGETERARELLTQAVERSGPDDLAASVLERVHRLGRAPSPGAVGLADAGARLGGVAPVPAVVRARRVSLPVVAVAAAVAGALVAGVAIELWFAAPAGRTPAAETRADELPVPRGADVALMRARTLAAGGHLPDALRALEAIGRFDAQRPEADRLQAEWQARLLELDGLDGPGTGGGR
ncbi:MAG: hypothetical protein AB7P67_14830 [Vicinamibacterales bacterium]